jgi:hypothetical protein
MWLWYDTSFNSYTDILSVLKRYSISCWDNRNEKPMRLWRIKVRTEKGRLNISPACTDCHLLIIVHQSFRCSWSGCCTIPPTTQLNSSSVSGHTHWPGMSWAFLQCLYWCDNKYGKIALNIYSLYYCNATHCTLLI